MLDEQTAPKKRDPRALNAYRHGLTGQVQILTPADQVAYEKHCQAIDQSLAPVSASKPTAPRLSPPPQGHQKVRPQAKKTGQTPARRADVASISNYGSKAADCGIFPS